MKNKTDAQIKRDLTRLADKNEIEHPEKALKYLKEINENLRDKINTLLNDNLCSLERDLVLDYMDSLIENELTQESLCDG